MSTTTTERIVEFSSDNMDDVVECNEETLELSQLPAISVQSGNDFTRYVKEGLSADFKIKHIDNGSNNGRDVIEHDSNVIHYFAEDRSCIHYSQRTFGRTPTVINKEWFDMKVENLIEFRKLKDDLLSKPFMLEIFFDAERFSCNIAYVLPRTCLIVTINPKHPSIATLLSEAFVEADDNLQNDTAFSIEINLRPALKQWYLNELSMETGESWRLGSEGRWHLTIYNVSPRIIFCPNFCAVILYALFCMFGPLICLVYYGYKLHRHQTCNIIDVKLTEPPCCPGILM